ncbi:hypothetical protein EV186_103560 [Labedaea rhizosphaerae]|uniref:Uncharacterized protein n=1 Tax=Labedaea rhizosphaerae TaxID=598644 RepID=A0A4R6SEU8_LABRH|nr:hypothetical protein EV186_103560 [Labedaea rhizosphaerae]
MTDSLMSRRNLLGWGGALTGALLLAGPAGLGEGTAEALAGFDFGPIHHAFELAPERIAPASAALSAGGLLRVATINDPSIPAGRPARRERLRLPPGQRRVLRRGDQRWRAAAAARRSSMTAGVRPGSRLATTAWKSGHSPSTSWWHSRACSSNVRACARRA